MFRTISLTTLTAIALTAPAFAQDTAPSGWDAAGTATFATDYVFRGFSQTDERPAVQGSITVNHSSGFSASLWGSNVDFSDGDEGTAEIDATLSYTIPVGPGNLTLGGIYYAYPGANDDLNYNYVEAFAGYALNVAKTVDVNAQVFYSPNYFAGSGDSVYAITSLTIPVKPVEGLSVVGSAAYSWIDDEAQFGAPDYADWSAGLSYTWDKLTVSAKYQDTDVSEDRCSGLCGERIVGALTYAF